MRGLALLVLAVLLLAGCASVQPEQGDGTTDAPVADGSDRVSRRGKQSQSSDDEALGEGKIESPSGFEWRSKAMAGGDLFLQFTVDNQGSKDCEGFVATAGRGPMEGPLYVSVGTSTDGEYGGWGVSHSGGAARVSVAGIVDTSDVLVSDGTWYGRFQFSVDAGDTSRFTFMTRDLAASENEYTQGDAFVFEVDCGGPSAVTDMKAGRNVHLFDESTMEGGVQADADGEAAVSVQATMEADFRDPEVLAFLGVFPNNIGQFVFEHPSGEDTYLLIPEGADLFTLTDGPGGYTGTLDKVGGPFLAYTWGAWAGVHPITTLADLEAIPVS